MKTLSVLQNFSTAVNGLGGDDVRLSKEKFKFERLRWFELGKVGPVDGNDHVGGNYAAALNFEANLLIYYQSHQIQTGLF